VWQHGANRAAARLATARGGSCAAERAGELINEHDPTGPRRTTGNCSALVDADSSAATKTKAAELAAARE
jgi:hypothetical protein